MSWSNTSNDASDPRSDGWRLHFALQKYKPLKVLREIIDADRESLKRKVGGRMLALHLAAAIGSPVDVVELLVDRCPEALTAKTLVGTVPMHVAAEHADVQVVEFLADACPETLTDKDEYGSVPLHLAAERAEVEVVELLVKKCPTALMAKDNSGWLPLHVAAQHAKVVVVELLADKCLDALEERTNAGSVPLHVAAEHATFEVVELLVDKCPEALEVKDESGWLPLHIAAQHEKVDVVELLADKCPNSLEERTNAGSVPLHVAAANDVSVELVQRLVDKCPAALMVKDQGGWLPLHIAAQHAKLEVVQYLAHQRPEALWSRTVRVLGELPVDISRRHERHDVTQWLRTAMDDKHLLDRYRLGRVVRRASHEPVVVSSAYVKSICTKNILGEGFFGTVYRGRDSILGCRFAIKSINADILRGGTESDRVRAVESFQREQEALSRFRHPNIAALFAYTDMVAEGESAGCYLVYELAEKGSLKSILEKYEVRSRIAFRRRVQIAVDVFTAIRFLHEGRGEVASCFHRDIKSANIVIKRNFTAQIIDCGVAKFVRDDDTNPTSTGTKGTKGYTCPEYLSGVISYEAKCDVFSFGVVLAELWTGMLQNKPVNFAKKYVGKGKKLDLILQGIDPSLDYDKPLPEKMRQFADLSLSCMAHDIEDRPPGEEVLERLQSILEARAKAETLVESTELVVNTTIPSTSCAVKCPNCLTFLVSKDGLCSMCWKRKEDSARFQDLQKTVEAMKATVDTNNRIVDAIKVTVDMTHKKVVAVDAKVESTLPVLADLNGQINNQMPRLCILVPADIKSGWEHPRSWLRSNFLTKFHLYFVCALSPQAGICPPIKLTVAKKWVQTAAPFLAWAVFALQAALKVGLNLSLDLEGFKLSSEQIGQMADILSEILKEDGHKELVEELEQLEKLENNLALSQNNVQVLSGKAYEKVRDEALKQCEWRSRMKLVRGRHSAQVIWVAKKTLAMEKYKDEYVPVEV